MVLLIIFTILIQSIIIKIMKVLCFLSIGIYCGIYAPPAKRGKRQQGRVLINRGWHLYKALNIIAMHQAD